MAPSRHDWKIVDWDVKPQHNQQTKISQYKNNIYLIILVQSSADLESNPKCVLTSVHNRQNMSFYTQLPPPPPPYS